MSENNNKAWETMKEIARLNNQGKSDELNKYLDSIELESNTQVAVMSITAFEITDENINNNKELAVNLSKLEHQGFREELRTSILVEKLKALGIIVTPSNENIKVDWKLPFCGIEGYKPVAFFYKNKTIDLDFFNEEKCDYLSEYNDLVIEIIYPFIENYEPKIEDWKKLGFDAHFE